MHSGISLPFTVVSREGTRDVTMTIQNLVIAGWTGRDKEAMEKHIRELEELGVPRPATTPVYYRLSASRLNHAHLLEVHGTDSSGEVEFMMLRQDGKLYVGLWSDHTDRKLETMNVTLSKQLCDKPVSIALWPYDEVRDHWDSLILRSRAKFGDAEPVLYQEGPITTMLDPEDLMAGFVALDGPFADGTAMFCGTLAARGGIRHASHFSYELYDPILDRTIAHWYQIKELAVRG